MTNKVCDDKTTKETTRATSERDKMPKGDNNDIFKQKRIVMLNSEVTCKVATDFQEELFKLQLQDPSAPIVVLINSPGGSVTSMWAMVDAMDLLSCPIYTLACGEAMSAASIVLANGEKGKRFATPNTYIMLHQVRSGMAGKNTEIQNYAKWVDEIQRQIDRFFIAKTKITRKTIRQYMDIDTFVDAKKALELGVIDSVITDFAELRVPGW